MSDEQPSGLSPDELDAQEVTALPDKEVVSILDLNADINLAIDAAAPIDLGVAANANIAAPIDAAVGANVLSIGSDAQALSEQGTSITQGLHADAVAHATQGSGIDQSNDGTAGATDPATGTTAPTSGTTDPTSGTTSGATSTVGDLSNGNLLDVNVNVDANADVAAPIDGAVAANANVAAPIEGSVAANVGSVDSHAVSVAQQTAIINQQLDGSANATTDQSSNITQ